MYIVNFYQQSNYTNESHFLYITHANVYIEIPNNQARYIRNNIEPSWGMRIDFKSPYPYQNRYISYEICPLLIKDIIDLSKHKNEQ